MRNLLSWHFWLNTRPDNLATNIFYYFVLLLGLMVFLTVIFGMLKAKKRGLYYRIWAKLYNFFLTNFFIGLLLLFFTYEAIPFLSTRVWFLLWLAAAGTWLVFIGKLLVSIPKIKLEKARENEFKKYIP